MAERVFADKWCHLAGVYSCFVLLADEPKTLMFGVNNAEATYFNFKSVDFSSNSLQH